MARIRTIKPEEAAEFRGLFFGEGHLDLMKNGRAGTLYPRARIAVRDDDAAVLEWCRGLFGGSISRSPHTRSACWQLTGRERIGHLLDALEGGTLPSKKRREVALMRQAHQMIGPRGTWATDEVKWRLRMIRDDLKAARAYVSGVA